MSNQVRLREATDRGVWDDAVASFDQGLMFHEWDWLDLQEAVQGVVFDRLLVEAEDRVVGVFPSARPGPRSLKAPPMPFPFLGPLVRDEQLPDTLRAWRRRQWRRGPPLARFDVGPVLAEGWRAPVVAAGCEVRPLDTVVIDLQHGSETELQAAYSRSHRRSLKRAVKAGAEVRRSAPGEVTELLPALLDEAYEARGSRSPYPRHTGRLVEEWLHGREDAVALTAEVQGEAAGALIVLGGHPTALAWVGGCFRRFRDVSANVLLYDAGCLWAIEQQCTRMDLCASVDEGVLRFKLGFGGTEVSGLSANSFLLPARALATARSARDALR